MSENPHSASRGQLESCSAIVPTRDRPEPLVGLVRSLLAQTITPVEVVIVDQSTRRDSQERIEALSKSLREDPGQQAKIVYIRDPTIDGAARARNAGARAASGDWLVFCDDDGEVAADAFRHLRDALQEHEELLAVGGIITTYSKPAPLTRFFARVFNLGRFWDERQPAYWRCNTWAPAQIIPSAKLNGGLLAVHRGAFEGIGGFDPRYRGASVGEDLDFSERLILKAGRSNVIALVGGAWLRHDALGEWRDPVKVHELELIATSYRFRKNSKKTPVELVTFAWYVVGHAVRALLSSVRRVSPRPLASFWSAVRCVRSGFRGCSFLDPPNGGA